MFDEELADFSRRNRGAAISGGERGNPPTTPAMMLIGFVGLGYAAARRKGAVRAISASLAEPSARSATPDANPPAP
jgi:hypothetical protein